MRKSAKVGLATLAIIELALALAPLINANGLAISHPRVNDLKMGAGESREFQFAIYNYGAESVTVEIIAEGLDGVAELDPEILTVGPGSADSPTIEKVKCVLTPPHEGVFEGDVMAYPVEVQGGVSLSRGIGFRVKITATEAETQPPETEPELPESGGGIPMPLIACSILGIGAAGALVLKKRGRKK